MAAVKSMTDLKLLVVVENGTTASGKKSTKNITFSQVKLTATDEELLAAGNAVAGLLSSSLSGLKLVNTYDLAEST
ncbi:DUF1659 domain-containing protein [uncultured Dialister sp.]|uniref:DUF1659 domain-containing protein n=1 Tax=uncultured Dialister sp. TaxID=278064 RepID=UPI0025F8A09F|nr:DUF1659 domain-containing protein [uncultured Dialister sp.]